MKKTSYDLGTVARIYHEEARPVFHAPRGNTKLGAIPAWNLAPGLTCSQTACKTCLKEGCYALKNMLAHGYTYSTNNVLKAWLDNTKLADEDLEQLEKKLDAYLTILELGDGEKKFRIHSGGDYKDIPYMAMWNRLAAKHPKIRFLSFTKQFDMLREFDSAAEHPFYTLENFSMVLSAWPDCDPPEDLKRHYYVAYCIEKGDELPENSFLCPGNCDSCGKCWFLKEIGQNSAFVKH